ncbi:response regulator transcription factor [Actinomyces sp. MRS3W]|uniref:response regulator transcription factor n=1 Tax=Actinomyces sp. MRS3W TaxID=2800796 RepID=UPI0028FD6282|nr:response regulator transcription factor [Actinomyces sp. MRS3W]MDU0347332.1 response regulator transcription factor [Actinomyces sp. MRS3W]
MPGDTADEMSEDVARSTAVGPSPAVAASPAVAPKLVALVVDDEPQMRYVVSFALETQGFECLTAPDAEVAWELLSSRKVDLVVLDVMLPGGSGVALCRRLRGTGSRVPIILLTALRDEQDRIAGLEAGADDYVTKPFSPRELALRARAVTRRAGAGPDAVENGPLRISTVTGRVSWEGRNVPLPDTEARLLAALARRRDAVVTWQELLNEVWGTSDDSGGKEMVRTTIYRLRRHLKAHDAPDDVVVSVRGRGYRMPPLGQD